MCTIEHPTSPVKLQPEYLDTPGASALTGLSVRALDTLRYRGMVHDFCVSAGGSGTGLTTSARGWNARLLLPLGQPPTVTPATMGATMAKPAKPAPLQHFTVEETARLLGVSPKTVRREIDDGWLPATKIRGAIRISYADIERYTDTFKTKIRQKQLRKKS